MDDEQIAVDARRREVGRGVGEGDPDRRAFDRGQPDDLAEQLLIRVCAGRRCALGCGQLFVLPAQLSGSGGELGIALLGLGHQLGEVARAVGAQIGALRGDGGRPDQQSGEQPDRQFQRSPAHPGLLRRCGRLIGGGRLGHSLGVVVGGSAGRSLISGPHRAVLGGRHGANPTCGPRFIAVHNWGERP